VLLFAEMTAVYVVLEGGPSTLETVRKVVEKGTPAIIVKVFLVMSLDMMNVIDDECYRF